MKKPQLGISLMTEPAFLEACFPLFAEGEIEVLEWSFDTIQTIEDEPLWLNELLSTYSRENKLLGHGVYYSLFDAYWGDKQDLWINKIKKKQSDINTITYLSILDLCQAKIIIREFHCQFHFQIPL
ncbi:hypothetical protein FPS14_contig00009-0067 [Flavobacterium psychrophilum]|nr:hypothetical protein FPS14_contig00009-0067 [Flavobacterium psychrophilum]